MGPDLVKTAKRLDEDAINVNALLAGDLPDADLWKPVTVAAPARGAKPAATPKVLTIEGRRVPADALMETPTVVVAADTLKTFAATDYPLLIVTDGASIVRFIGVLPEAGMDAGMYLDRASQHVASTWPKTPAQRP